MLRISACFLFETQTHMATDAILRKIKNENKHTKNAQQRTIDPSNMVTDKCKGWTLEFEKQKKLLQIWIVHFIKQNIISDYKDIQNIIFN